jgi:hypothetical protein
MRKQIDVSAIIFLFAVLLFSCGNTVIEDNQQTEMGYAVYRNFSNLPAKGIRELPQGEPIIGVLLTFTSDGPYSNEVYSKDDDAFSIYCLFNDHGINGDGMEFNYVLYVPEDIKNQYIRGNGRNPQSGNPFWWYMATYFGSSLSVITGDWYTVIDMLCSNNDLPKANCADIGKWSLDVAAYSTWQDDYSDSCSASNIEAFINYENDQELVIMYNYETLNERKIVVFDPLYGALFKISGPKLQPGSGILAFIVPVNLVQDGQSIKTNIYVSDTDQCFSGIKLSGSVSNLPKAYVPINAIIVQQ